MSRLAYFLTALWLSSAAAHPGLTDVIGEKVNEFKKNLINEMQAFNDHFGQRVAAIGNKACQGVKKIAGVSYDNFEEEPDMSKLNVVVTNGDVTESFNLATAVEEIRKQPWYDPTLPVIIFLHGFTDDPSKTSFQTMQTAFRVLEKAEGKVNILALDASSMIKWYYARASTMVQFIGQKLGATMAVTHGLEPKPFIHLIGHSLGSHIAAFAAKQYFLLTGSKVDRITGLDPASPCFSNLDESLRLSENDAEFVDVIHTDAGVFGMKQSIGHVDFWPNNGEEQRGCLMQTCSHSRAWAYFAESVENPLGFQAVRCNSSDDFRHGLCDYNDTSIMGYHTPNTTRGNYYCITYDEEPFGAGEEGLTYKNDGIIRTVKNFFKDLFGR